MNRREFLGAVGTSVGVVVPYNSATPYRDTDDADEPRITEEPRYVVDAYAAETGRVFRVYHVNHSGHQWSKWAMDTVDDERLYEESYPSDSIKMHSRGRTLLIKFWRDSEYQGNEYISLDEDYTYHTHDRDDENIQYRVHIEKDEYERIQ